MTEPWAAMSWEVPGDPPRLVAALRKQERQDAAELARAAAELREHLDERHERAVMEIDGYRAMTGREYPSEAEQLEQWWAADDAQLVREHRRELIAAGLLRVIDGPPTFAAPSSAPPQPSSAVSAARLGRVRTALARWSGDQRRAERRREAPRIVRATR